MKRAYKANQIRILETPIRLIIMVICFLILCPMLHAQEKLDISNLEFKDKINIIPFVDIYKVQEKIDVSYLEELILNESIELAPNKSSQGISNSYYWVKFTIDWQQYESDIILELDNPHLDEVLLYQKTNNSFNKIGFGGDKGYKFKDRSYINRRFIFPLEKKSSSTSYFLMIDKRGTSVSFPLMLWDKNDFENNEAKQSIFYGFYFGIIFLIGILSIIIGIILWRRIFIAYGIYTFCVSLFIFTSLGFSFQYFYPLSDSFNNAARLILGGFSHIAAVSFIILFLHIKENSTKITIFLRSTQIFYILLFLLWLLWPNIYDNYSYLLLYSLFFTYSAAVILFIISALKVLETHKLNAITFFISFIFILIGFGISNGIEAGFIEHSLFSINPLLIAFGIEVFALTIVMMFHLRDIVFKNKLLVINKEVLEKHQEVLKMEHSKLQEQYSILNKNKDANQNGAKIILKSKAVLKTDDIQYISSDGHYLEFYLNYKKTPEIDRNTIKNCLAQLPSNFIQIHRSYILNTDYLKMIKFSEIILANGKVLPVSRSFKFLVKEYLNEQ